MKKKKENKKEHEEEDKRVKQEWREKKKLICVWICISSTLETYISMEQDWKTREVKHRHVDLLSIFLMLLESKQGYS